MGSRPKYYVAALAAIAFASYGFKLYSQGIFACPADGYGDGWYLAYCNAEAYGDYDHGVFWYPLMPDAIEKPRDADVLLLGSSRMQFGFSTAATRNWFDSRDVSHYLLGFTHDENVVFVGPLVDKIRPTPKALIINIDRFFQQRVSGPTADLFAGGDTPARYDAKWNWQPVHRFVCARAEMFCGDNYVVFRERDAGHWKRFGTNHQAEPGGVGVAEDTDPSVWPDYVVRAREYLNGIDVESNCVFLTAVPSPETTVQEERWLSEQLGYRLFLVHVPGLRTFDSSHLDEPSAEIWSTSFFNVAESAIDRCLSGNQHSAGADS